MDVQSSPERFTLVSLRNAVFCVDCEMVSDSPYEVCTGCGSRSVVSLCRLLGGSLLGPGAKTKSNTKCIKYNLVVTVKVYEVAANDLNRVIGSITQIAQAGGNVQCLHLNVESVLASDRQSASKAA
jgi:hypothetical protein